MIHDTLTVISHIPRHEASTARKTRARCGTWIVPIDGTWLATTSRQVLPYLMGGTRAALIEPCKRCAHIPKTWRYRP